MHGMREHILGELGYEFVEAQPVDMFPHTMHVEAVTLLTK
jgi:23S rRNA (uracil1939-C5)-methyltransferase